MADPVGWITLPMPVGDAAAILRAVADRFPGAQLGPSEVHPTLGLTATIYQLSTAETAADRPDRDTLLGKSGSGTAAAATAVVPLHPRAGGVS